MTNVLILGANGQIARFATELFLKRTDVILTLYLRNSQRLKNVDRSRARVVEGDVLDSDKLKEPMAGQDVVYANLAGDLERHLLCGQFLEVSVQQKLHLLFSVAWRILVGDSNHRYSFCSYNGLATSPGLPLLLGINDLARE